MYQGLPDYMYCEMEDCELPHFLNFNRDIDGKWCAGYVEFENHTAIATINSADTLDEAVIRVKASIKRRGI